MTEPSRSAATDDVERINEFARWLEDVTSTRSKPWRLGTALFHDEFPGRYDSNFLRVERPVGGATAADLAGESDRVLGGFAHREIVVEVDAEGERLAPGFADLGWRVDRLVYLVHRRPPDREPNVEAIDEVEPDDVREVMVAVSLAEGIPRAEAEMLADFRWVLRDRAGARFFAARLGGAAASPAPPGGAVAGYCELYVRDDIAQVESVNTLEPYRGRGLARAFVMRAVQEGRTAGADLVFLCADEADWPKELYSKLGFDRVGRFWQFTREPARASA